MKYKIMAHGNNNSNERKVSSFGAFVTFFKSLFGAGLLALPNVFNQVGLVLGVSIYMTVGVVCTYSCYLLLRARELAQEIRQTTAADTNNETLYVEYTEVGNKETTTSKTRNKRPTSEDHLVTYGDLTRILLGTKAASMVRWTIIILNVLFSAGLVICIIENVASIIMHYSNNDDDNIYNDNNVVVPPHLRHQIGLVLFPIVTIILQIPWLQDMYLLSTFALVVYVVGVVGTSMTSAIISLIHNNSDNSIDDVNYYDKTVTSVTPTDMWDWKWKGIPTYIGTAIYALEGINLALPTVHSMTNQHDAIPVVCSGIFTYAVVTAMFASIAFAGGLGGGQGTAHSSQECDVVTNCITPNGLKIVLQLALSLALLLSVPVMLYPSTEMLEVLLTDLLFDMHFKEQNNNTATNMNNQTDYGRDNNDKEFHVLQKELSMVAWKEGYNNNNHQCNKTDQGLDHKIDTYSQQHHYGSIESLRYDTTTTTTKMHSSDHNDPHKQVLVADIEAKDEEYSQQKMWQLRTFLSILIVSLASVTPSFTVFSGLIGAVGLTLAGFIFPPLLYTTAMIQCCNPISIQTKLCLGGTLLFGIYNIIVGGTSSLTQIFAS